MKIKTVIGLAAAATVVLMPVGAALAGTSAAGAAPSTHTVETVVRPVHANGTPVAGYAVHSESIDGFNCDGPSTVSVSKNVYECGPSATYTVACWKSTRHTVLCLRDPYVRQLARITYSGTLSPVRAPKRAVPQALTLAGGAHCLIRDGGAWDQVNGHRNWYGAYSCPKGDLYGPAAFQGIDTALNPWLVHMLTYDKNGTQHIANQRVVHAYVVGTAS